MMNIIKEEEYYAKFIFDFIGKYLANKE